MFMEIPPAWEKYLGKELNEPYFRRLRAFLEEEKARGVTIYPPEECILNALKYVAPQDVKAVIVGQDPYHGEGEAMGLSFSVPESCPVPPSLQNIFKELTEDIGCPMPKGGDLTPWAKEGVLLLNAVLTVRANAANSHMGKGWEFFTNRIISLIGRREKPAVFILWGKNAQKKRSWVHPRHLIIESAHPSPLSAHRGFFGSRPFSKANKFLADKGIEPINWQLP